MWQGLGCMKTSPANASVVDKSPPAPSAACSWLGMLSSMNQEWNQGFFSFWIHFGNKLWCKGGMSLNGCQTPLVTRMWSTLPPFELCSIQTNNLESKDSLDLSGSFQIRSEGFPSQHWSLHLKIALLPKRGPKLSSIWKFLKLADGWCHGNLRLPPPNATHPKKAIRPYVGIKGSWWLINCELIRPCFFLRGEWHWRGTLILMMMAKKTFLATYTGSFTIRCEDLSIMSEGKFP